MTSSARAGSSANLRTTTKRSMADGRGDGECVWKHSGFCKDGDVLIKWLAVCRIRKSQVKKHGDTTNLSNHLLRRHEISHNADRQVTSCSVTAAAAVQGNVSSAECQLHSVVLLMNSLYVVNNSRSSRYIYCLFNLKKCWLHLLYSFYVENESREG